MDETYHCLLCPQYCPSSWHCICIPGFVFKFKHGVDAMLHQEPSELCCHACKSRVMINWQQRRTNLYLTDKVTISLILNMFECLHVLVLMLVI